MIVLVLADDSREIGVLCYRPYVCVTEGVKC